MNAGVGILLLAFLFEQPCWSAPGLEVNLSRPFASVADPERPIVGLSLFQPRWIGTPGFDEWGITVLPPEDKSNARSGWVEEWAGVYAGHVFMPGSGWVRPGVEVGWVWQRTAEIDAAGAMQHADGFSLYLGGKLQVGLLTFTISNKGFGGGINFGL